MKAKKLILLLGVLLTLLSSLTLARCGSGLGPLNDATANGIKY